MTVILLSGVAGAVVLTVAAGARRASTSVDRYTASTQAADVLVNVTNADPGTRNAIARLPMVADSGSLSTVFAVIDGVDEDIALFFPNDERVGTAFEHDRLVRGRRPDTGQTDEVMLSEAAVAAIGADIGDRIEVATMTSEQVANEDYFPPRGPTLDLRVVGVTRGADDLAADGDPIIVGTRELLSTLSGHADVYATYMAIRVRSDASVSAFVEALHTRIPGGSEFGDLSLEVRTKPARDAIATLAVGLAVFALVAGATSIVVIALAVGRQVAVAATQQAALVALGMTRSARLLALTLLGVPIAIGGAVIAVIGSVLASPLMPIGFARRAEPDPGIAIDWWVAVSGFVAIIAVVIGCAAFAGWRIVRTPAFAPVPTPPSVPRLLASRLGASPVAATGVQLALDRRRPTIAGRSALSGVALAVLVVTAILTYSASLDRLLGSPDRWGYPWQLLLNFTSDEIDEASAEIAADSTFADVARWDSGYTFVDGAGTRAFGLTKLRGDQGFALRSGRQPVVDDEVVLGPTTADALGVRVGDSIEVAAGEGGQPSAVRVVGIALFPEIEDGDLTDGVGFLGAEFRASAVVADLFEASQVVVTLAPGNDISGAVAALGERYPESVSAESFPARPSGVANLTGVRRVPAAIAVFVALLGLVSMGHLLATTVRRRQRDLATLRCLGLTPRQTAGCIVWQAATIGTIGLMIGIPLGVITGRIAWWATSNPIGLRPDVDRPVAALFAVGAATVIGAMMLAAPIAWRAGQTAPASALRAE